MTEDRAADGLDHLQRAGRELIAAARAFLDVAEDVVADRERVAEVVAFVGTVAEAAGDAAGDAVRGARRAATDEPPGPSSPHVEHIQVS